MNFVRIGNVQRPLSEASERWISEQLQRRKKEGGLTCIQVVLKTGALDMVLSTGDCPAGGSGGRPPNERERSVFELWDRKGLNMSGPSVGNLVSFLQQLQRSL